MSQRGAGLFVTLAIIVGAILIVVLNLEPGGGRPSSPTPSPDGPKARSSAVGVMAPEYPIGEGVEKEHMRIEAVWLPAVHLAGGDAPSGSDVIHLEADIFALEGHPNGFGKGEFIPYLNITYQIRPADGGPTLAGALRPMIARDGMHYGVNLRLPRPGRYHLVYTVPPPSADLGRHDDPATGVAPWWSTFEAAYDWDYGGPSPRNP